VLLLFPDSSTVERAAVNRQVLGSNPSRGAILYMAFFVYILRNSIGRYYIGQTSDLSQRLQRHNDNKVFSTKNHGPWEIAYSQSFLTRSEAMAEEKRLKALKSKTAIDKLISQR
jgi:putative endonuclease